MSDCRFGVSPVNYPDPDPEGHSCETQLTMVINDWAIILDNRGKVDTFILDFEKAFDNPLMNSLKANCLAMDSVARH